MTLRHQDKGAVVRAVLRSERGSAHVVQVIAVNRNDEDGTYEVHGIAFGQMLTFHRQWTVSNNLQEIERIFA